MARRMKLLKPIHAGEIPREDFLKAFGISINQLARDLDVPSNRISLIANGERAITADTALRLGTYFGVSPEIWLNLQSDTKYGQSNGCAVQRDQFPLRGIHVPQADMVLSLTRAN